MDSTEVLYLPTASGPMPVAAQINGRLYAINADHLNTPRRLTNTQGQVAWQWLISGFGEVQPTTGATGYALNGIPSSKVYSEAVTFKLRYPGQVWDEETGLAYNLHRYYDAQVGRYMQSDPIGLKGGINTYSYVEGNPLSYTDPTGLAPHSYEWRVFRCMGNCTAQTMKELLCNPAPGVSSGNEVQSGDKNTVGVGPMTLGSISTTADASRNTITNSTLPGHMLHPGRVQRQVVFDGEATWVVNTGGGDGPYSTLNDIGAPIVWGGTSLKRLPPAVGTSSSTSCTCP